MDTKQKTYRMLATVQGSRDGLKVETFTKGETYELDESLAEQFYHQGAIEEVIGKTNPADKREKKVTGPKETKDTDETLEGEAGVDLDTQNIEELVALARDTYGLEVDSTMSVEDVKALIEQAQGESTDEDDTDDTSPTKKPKKTKARK